MGTAATSARVWGVEWLPDDGVGWAILNDNAKIHDNCAAAEIADKRQIMRDIDGGERQISAYVAQQVENASSRAAL